MCCSGLPLHVCYELSVAHLQVAFSGRSSPPAVQPLIREWSTHGVLCCTVETKITDLPLFSSASHLLPPTNVQNDWSQRSAWRFAAISLPTSFTCSSCCWCSDCTLCSASCTTYITRNNHNDVQQAKNTCGILPVLLEQDRNLMCPHQSPTMQLTWKWPEQVETREGGKLFRHLYQVRWPYLHLLYCCVVISYIAETFSCIESLEKTRQEVVGCCSYIKTCKRT